MRPAKNQILVSFLPFEIHVLTIKRQNQFRFLKCSKQLGLGTGAGVETKREARIIVREGGKGHKIAYKPIHGELHFKYSLD